MHRVWVGVQNDPLSGVIGVQKAPLISIVQDRPVLFGGKIGMLVAQTVVRGGVSTLGKPIKEIARDLWLSRKIIGKPIRSPEAAFDDHRSVQLLARIGPFRERLDTLLAENEARPRCALG